MIDFENGDPEAATQKSSDDGSQREPRYGCIIVAFIGSISSFKEDSKGRKVIGFTAQLGFVARGETFIDALPFRRIFSLVEEGETRFILLVSVVDFKTDLDVFVEICDLPALCIKECDVDDGRDDIRAVDRVGNVCGFDGHPSWTSDNGVWHKNVSDLFARGRDDC